MEEIECAMKDGHAIQLAAFRQRKLESFSANHSTLRWEATLFFHPRLGLVTRLAGSARRLYSNERSTQIPIRPLRTMAAKEFVEGFGWGGDRFGDDRLVVKPLIDAHTSADSDCRQSPGRSQEKIACRHRTIPETFAYKAMTL